MTAAFQACLATRFLGRATHWLETTASTNGDLRALAENGAPEGMLVIAESQSAGRGRFDREWQSAAGQNLTFSILLRPEAPIETRITLPLVIGLAVAETLRGLGIEAGVKWPNDVLAGGKKVCGILCESCADAAIIAGIGLNVNQAAFPAAIAHRAASLCTLLGKPLDRPALLAALCNTLEPLYSEWLAAGLAPLLPRLRALDCRRGRRIAIQQDDSSPRVEGICLGIADDGALLIQTGSASVERIVSGEIPFT